LAATKTAGSRARRSTPAKANGAARTATEQPSAGNSPGTEPAVLEEILDALVAARDGDFSRRLSRRRRGLLGEIASAYNELVTMNGRMEKELGRMRRVIGREGRMDQRASLGAAGGGWSSSVESLNALIDDLVRPTTEVASVLDAVADGDLDRKMALTIEGQPVKGEFLRIGTTVNTMVDQLSSFADEVTRVAREVGTEGKLGGQAEVKGVSGTWRDLTESVNGMASNLTDQVRNISHVAQAVARGDLSQKITVEAKGEVAELADTMNEMTDTLAIFAEQVTSVAREVGTDGNLGGQAEVPNVSGTWKDLTESVNGMASNLTSQVRNIAQVMTAVAGGDLTQRITVDVKGEILELKNTTNTMVDQLSSFADEVTRVAREVGTEGKLGGQAEVPNVAGTWKDLTDSVNLMATNLTDQVRDIAQVTTAVAEGDLSQKVTVDVQGEIAELKETVNTMVDQLSSFADEVTRVAREVGTEGILGGQAEVKGVSGTWRDLTESVNFMASNLTDQVRSIAQVSTAVADGDLSQKISVEAKGEVAALADTINKMVDRLRSFAAEVTRVAREVGTEGKLGGQAEVEDVSGTWRGLTENVNSMASNLTDQVRNIAEVTTAVANGDLSKKITVDAKGEILELKNTVNTMVDQLNSFAAEVTRVSREVGTDGKLGGQAEVEDVSGTWRSLTESVNFMASNLTDQVRSIALVTTAVANGDLSKKISVEAKGEIAELKETINTMVDQLNSFAAEVTRVAKEVGTEGKLGGQAEVAGVSGTWRGLTENVNSMASNLTDQVRNISQVAQAVARGDLTQKITVDAKGEILELKDTLNTMVDQLSSFADEVTRVAKEVGTEGKLGGQAQVEGVSGTWRGLTENVNQLASNLTTQVRAIAEVSTAVTQGDLTRSITVEASGEVADLSDNINQMIANLRETTRQNEEQDWLKTNLARISGLMQGQRNLETVSQLIMSELSPAVGAQHGAFFFADHDELGQTYELMLLASYGYTRDDVETPRFKPGDGLVGQAAHEKKPIRIVDPPEDYIRVASGLGSSAPRDIIVIPVLFEEQVLAVIELASFTPFNEIILQFLDQLTETIGVVLSTIIANVRTEELLQQSQSQSQELQEQSEALQRQQMELQATNDELQEKAEQLERQNRDIEIKNREIELARSSLEEKAEQLALSSKYKSEFLANMSHELRTPLNSLLILSKVLSANEGGNLTAKQVDASTTIHNAGSDLLALINDILDLSKVEAGKMDVHAGRTELRSVREFVERSFAPVAGEKGLDFSIELAPDAPEQISTDEQRLQQVLKNLLSNAFKFTESGSVRLAIGRAPADAHYSTDSLARAGDVVGFSVIDTGIGIPPDKLRLIFEAFQQAEGSISRRFGGTGLGLSISREIARLLGGEIHVESTDGEGSRFTLYLPVAGPVAVSVPPASIDGPRPLPLPTTRSRRRVEGVGLPDTLTDDRSDLPAGERVVLVMTEDRALARGAVDVAHEHGFRCLLALRGDAGLALVHEFMPDAVIVSRDLPQLNGEAVLDHLKRHPETRHLPVYVLAAQDGQVVGDGAKLDLRHAGALGSVTEAATPELLGDVLDQLGHFLERHARAVLLVESDERERDGLGDLIGGPDVEVVGAGSREEALAELDSREFDCVVLTLELEDGSGFQLLDRLRRTKRFRDLPVIVHTRRELSPKDEARLKRYAESIVVKDVRSPERLLDETSLYLHRVEARLPADKRQMLERLHMADAVFEGKKVLIVDDDVRNVFALTSVFERRGMEVVFAENGREGIEALKANPDISLVLMDIMMPEMDGYEATRAMREMPEFQRLPIVALTAKAMKGDREKSIASGASDYITKPVDVDQLLSLMRVWLYR
jgi:HAMP domain-containing protein/signal transduction histidine kinase/DNA-binding response OmpR family regulator